MGKSAKLRSQPSRRRLPAFATLLLCVIAGAGSVGSAQEEQMLVVSDGDLRIEIPAGDARVERRAVELLAAEVRRRTGVGVSIGIGGNARNTLAIGTRSSTELCELYGHAHGELPVLASDGFHIATTPDASGRIYLIGDSPSGVVAGVGRLLRLARYRDGAVAIPETTLTDAPALPVRGIYFATHFHNFYHVAPLAEIDDIIEEHALWGGNHLIVWFDMHHFQSFDDPAAQEHLRRLQHFAETAQAVGMKFGLGFIANEAYDSSPEELRANPNTGTAHYQRELCPSKPRALELIGQWQAEVLDAFPRLDFIWSWPYDQGGCACEDCAPWGANGFLKASEQLSGLYRSRHPEGTFWLSTWLLDQVNAKGEFDGLMDHVRRQEPEWFDGIVVGTHGDWVPGPLLSRPYPARYPLAAFPEISMYGMNPWGEHGANPLPAFCTRLADNLRGQIAGGWPYSEGIYEDLNKVFWSRFFWHPDAATDEILREYAAYYLSPDVADDAVRMLHVMEETHARNGWSVANLDGADEEWALARGIDERLPDWARESWRWRILYIRATIDGILQSQGFMTPDSRAELQRLCDELVRIYHADQTFIRPSVLPEPPDPANLAFGCEVTISSFFEGGEARRQHLVDGVLSQHDGENFWCHNRDREETAEVTIDLGKTVQVGEVKLQYRGIRDAYWFVPEALTFEVSADGEAYREALTSTDVPVEGDTYSPDLWTYSIDAEARYVRVGLGKSQHAGDQWTGSLELTEIEVHAE